LAGCGVFAPRTSVHTDGAEVASGVQHSGVLMSGGTAYAVTYTSHGLWRDQAGNAGAGQAVPQVTVARADGQPITQGAREKQARQVAKAYCLDHPEFSRQDMFGDGMVLENGAVIYSEICD
jgi:hypothetical protein